MNKQEAIELLNTIQQDIISNPSQFQIEIHHTGQSITSNGGIGLSITMNGGGAEGSTTIGNQVTMNAGQIEFRNKQINSAVNEHFNALLQAIDDIKSSIAQDSLDKNKAKSRVLEFAGKLIPSVVTAAILKIIELL